MRSGFIIGLMVTVLFSGGYFYYVAQAICPIPLEYSIGEIDESFGITFDEVKLVLAEAESIWEDATGQNLFTYSEDADFTVSFVYDDRQAQTDAEGEFKDKLDTTQNAADALNQTYAQLVEEYDTLQTTYSQKADRYETNITAYNTQVEELNAKGGASPGEYEVLEERKEELAVERAELNELGRQLNSLVAEINKVGDRGNKLIETYNRGVAEYNNTFGHSREFTQGTYSTDGEINIYAFDSKEELRLVLAHELGHAISLDHVANEESIMYFLIGDQPVELEPTEEDMAEYVRICSEMSMWDTIKTSLTR